MPTNNYGYPIEVIQTTAVSVSDGLTSQIYLPDQVILTDEIYRIGYLRLSHEVTIESSVAEEANIGSVVSESSIRRNLGTWHREQGGYVHERYSIEHPLQRWVWQGETYPLTRSAGADPGWIAPNAPIKWDGVLNQDAVISAMTGSLDYLTVANPALNSNQPVGSVPPLIFRPSVPQYLLTADCFRIKTDRYQLRFGFFQPPNYKPKTAVNLVVDDKSIVIRPRKGVTCVVNYNAYIAIATDPIPQTVYEDAGTPLACLNPRAPVYYPPEPPQLVLTLP